MKKPHLAFPMKCSDCVHFKGIKSPSFKEVCSKLGVKAYANACPSFTPDTVRVANINNNAIAAIAKVASKADLSQLRLLASTLLNAAEVKKFGFDFGQKVWFNLSNPYADYLECYFHGYVIGCTDTHIHVASNLELGLSVSIYLETSALFDESLWQRKKKALIKRGHLVLPAKNNSSRIRFVGVEPTQVEEEDYEVPTLDFAPAEFLPDDTPTSTDFDEREEVEYDDVESSEGRSGSLSIGF
jgi:hypothetical protein